jgi:predicted DNA-binding transcriptional regulator AlpA
MKNLTDIPESGYVTPHWVKLRYAISNSTMYSWVSVNYLPPLYKVGPRAVRFRADDIRRFEDRLVRNSRSNA